MDERTRRILADGLRQAAQILTLHLPLRGADRCEAARRRDIARRLVAYADSLTAAR